MFDFALMVAGSLGLGVTVWAVISGRERWILNGEDLDSRAQAMATLCDALEAAGARDYLCSSKIAECESLNPVSLGPATRFAGTAQRRRLREAEARLKSVRERIPALRDEFVQQAMQEAAPLLDDVGGRELSPQQRLAVVRDENYNLVVAGAGAGKTATMAARIRYLVQHRAVRPDRILALAFGKKAALELEERLISIQVPQVQVSTMHALGLRIVTEVEGRGRGISRLATDDEFAKDFVADFLGKQLSHPETRESVSLLLTDFLYAKDPIDLFEKAGDYYSRIREMGLRSLAGVLHKSLQEVKIANWLTLNGYDWAYEAHYPNLPPSKYKVRYNPDFLIRVPNSANLIWLEHFGVDRTGRTAPWINSEKYRKSMEWKRATHAEAGTCLIETYSYEDREGVLLRNLADRLAAQGAPPRAISEAEMASLLQQKHPARAVRDLAALILTFLRLFKGSLLQVADVTTRAHGQRDEVFIELFRMVLDLYERYLAAESKIDFDDMIRLAYGHVSEGRFVAEWQHLLVDEFQDTSQLRFALARSLVSQTQHGRMFMVGDDWQSIFRFAGADVSLLTCLSDLVGEVASTDLDRTHRCSAPLARLASEFVSADPQLLRKNIVSFAVLDPPAPASPALICYHDRDDTGSFGPSRALEFCLQDIAVQAAGRRVEVLVLGRYTWEQPVDIEHIAERWAGDRIQIRTLTVHKAKGTEADFIVVLGVNADRHGFPSGVTDDPVLNILLSRADSFPNAEERRLLYVAMTRAKRRVYLLADAARPSAFIQEIADLPEEFCIEVVNRSRQHYRCPLCLGRTIHRKSAATGEFWGCLNFPVCPGKLRDCVSCGDSPREPNLLSGRITEYRCKSCGAVSRVCPVCEKGEMILRAGQYGDFLGCSEWRTDGTGCPHTEKVKPLGPALSNPSQEYRRA